MNMRSKVRALQIKLFHAAKQSLDRKFGALYDKIYREDVLLEAWRRVKANRGAPGIDWQDFEYIVADRKPCFSQGIAESMLHLGAAKHQHWLCKVIKLH